jgi:linoleoyl-CoA desaturase
MDADMAEKTGQTAHAFDRRTDQLLSSEALLQRSDGIQGLGANAPLAVPRGDVKFPASDGFQQELKRRVERYFESTGQRERDCPRMYLKTTLVLVWLVLSYVLLVFFAGAWWLAAPLVLSLGLSMAAVGFDIQHDGGHQAYSSRRRVNKLMAMSLDLLGGSSYVWATKHNLVHHTFANITGHDDDINIGFFGRLSPHQKRLGFHRLQHIYLWALYGFLPMKWQLYDDFRDVLIGRIGRHRFARPKGWDLVTFLGGKIMFFSLALAIPLGLHSPWVVLPCYVAATVVQGVVLSIVFQMAHCVEEADFPVPRQDTGRMETAWAVHQVETTVDFARGNRLLFWFIGGLNFQIEHHLFPRICHVHYPALAHLVESTCQEFGVRYAAQATLRAGVASHFRWLRRMGAPSKSASEEHRGC